MSSKLKSDVCCRLQVAPSGERYGGNRRPGRKQRQTTAGYIWRDSLHVTCGLTACTPGSAPGPTLGNEYGKTLPFFYHRTSANTVLCWHCCNQVWHSTRFNARCYASAVVAMGLCLCQSVCHKSVYCRNGWTNRAGFWHMSFLPPVIHCVKRKFSYL